MYKSCKSYQQTSTARNFEQSPQAEGNDTKWKYRTTSGFVNHSTIDIWGQIWPQIGLSSAL